MQKLSPQALENKREYIRKYNKEKTKQIAISLNLKEYEEYKRRKKEVGNPTHKDILFTGLEEKEKNKKKL